MKKPHPPSRNALPGTGRAPRRASRLALIATPFAGIFALGWVAEQDARFGGVVSAVMVAVIVGVVARVLFHRPRPRPARKPEPVTGPSPAPAGDLVTTASATE